MKLSITSITFVSLLHLASGEGLRALRNGPPEKAEICHCERDTGACALHHVPLNSAHFTKHLLDARPGDPVPQLNGNGGVVITDYVFSDDCTPVTPLSDICDISEYQYCNRYGSFPTGASGTMEFDGTKIIIKARLPSGFNYVVQINSKAGLGAPHPLAGQYKKLLQPDGLGTPLFQSAVSGLTQVTFSDLPQHLYKYDFLHIKSSGGGQGTIFVRLVTPFGLDVFPSP